MAWRTWSVAIRPDTVFNIASLSKQFTAVSLLLLQEQGKLSQRLAGTYFSEELGASYTLKVVGQGLQAVVNYQPPLSFYAVDARRFYSKQHGVTLTVSGKGFELRAGRNSGHQVRSRFASLKRHLRTPRRAFKPAPSGLVHLGDPIPRTASHIFVGAQCAPSQLSLAVDDGGVTARIAVGDCPVKQRVTSAT